MWVQPTRSKDPVDVVSLHQEYGIVLGLYDGILLHCVGYPELNEDPAYLGHLCNDAAGKVARQSKYWKKARKHTNAIFGSVGSDLYKCIISMRPIAQGSEVLVPYGFDYWETKERLQGGQYRRHAVEPR